MLPLSAFRRCRRDRSNRAPMVFVALWTVALAGCAGFDWDDLTETFAPDNRQVNVQQGYLTGQIGPVANLDHPATDAYASSWGDTTDVSLTVSTGAGAAMAVITLQGPLAFDLRDGEQVTVYDSHGASTTGTRATVLGCSGPAVGQWQFDRPATSVSVLVERNADNPQWNTYSFVAAIPATVGDPGMLVSGSFNLEIE